VQRSLIGSIHLTGLISGADIGLRNARIDGSELTVSSFAPIGGANIYVPDPDLQAGPRSERRP
jgi:hypothetical protein